jgi:hypothetical protein
LFFLRSNILPSSCPLFYYSILLHSAILLSNILPLLLPNILSNILSPPVQCSVSLPSNILLPHGKPSAVRISILLLDIMLASRPPASYILVYSCIISSASLQYKIVLFHILSSFCLV